MRCPQRLIAASVLIALSCALGGCAGGLGSFDPTDLLDFLDTKKKLPGDRKPVFPEGVPGLEQGVPKELYKGSRQEQIDQQNAGAAAAPPAEEPKAKHAGKSKGKSKPAASTEPVAAPAAEAASEEDSSTAAAPPAPKPSKIARKRTTAPPQDQQPPQAAPSQQQSAGPFPAPLPSGTFAR